MFKDSPDFWSLLSQRSKERPLLKDREIVRRAGIEGSTLSALRTRSKRIKKPSLDLRLKLAIALGKDGNETREIARDFVCAAPAISNPSRWLDRLNELRIQLFQVEISNVELSVPFLANMAPIMVALRQGFLEQTGLHVTIDYARFSNLPKTLTENERDDEGSIRLAIYNRAAIKSEDEGIAFCFPLVARRKLALNVVGRASQIADGQAGLGSWVAAETKLVRILNGTWIDDSQLKDELRILLAERALDSHELSLKRVDQFDAFPLFEWGEADAVVPTPIEWLRIRRVQRNGSGPQTFERIVEARTTGEVVDFHGIVCGAKTILRPAAQRAIGQIIWAWHQGADFIAANREEAAVIVADHLNSRTNCVYKPEDCLALWEAEFFEKPVLPSEMVRRIEGYSGYVQRSFDMTNTLRLTLREIEELLRFGQSSAPSETELEPEEHAVQ